MGFFLFYPQAHPLSSPNISTMETQLQQVVSEDSKVGKVDSLPHTFPQVPQIGYHKMYAHNTATRKHETPHLKETWSGNTTCWVSQSGFVRRAELRGLAPSRG